MSAFLHKKAKVIIETPDGEILELYADIVKINQSVSFRKEHYIHSDMINFISESQSFDINLVGTGEIKTKEVFLEEIEEKTTLLEWLCDYCGTPNKRVRTKCESCGGSRSFLYS